LYIRNMNKESERLGVGVGLGLEEASLDRLATVDLASVQYQ